MNWSDERYVKLYTRDTLTWLSLGFEARAVLALLLRKVNGAGIMETGTLEAARAVAMQVVAPVDVVRKGLAELVEIGTVEIVPNGVLLPNFVEAQEATKTESRKKADQRLRDRDQRRQAQLIESLEGDVPRSPVVSRAVPLQPSPAQPSSPPAHHQPSSPPAQQADSMDQRDKPKRKRAKAQGEFPQVVPPPPPRAPTVVDRLYAHFAEARRLKILAPLSAGGLGMATCPPDDPPNWPRTGATIAAWLALWPEESEAHRESLATLLIDAFVEDPYWAGATHRDTKAPQPYPWNALLSEQKVWRKLYERLEAERNAPAAGAA